MLQISELSVPLEVRRCAAGQTPDNRFAATSQVPAWTGCRTCERGQVGLLPDRRATASELATAAATAATAAAGGGAGAGGAVAVAVATRQQLLLPQLTGRAMAGEVVRAYDGAEGVCRECPDNAECPGGRAVVPLPVSWICGCATCGCIVQYALCRTHSHTPIRAVSHACLCVIIRKAERGDTCLHVGCMCGPGLCVLKTDRKSAR